MNKQSFKIEKSKDNYDIVKVNIDEKWIYIGSKYNMENEINKFLEKADQGKKIIVFGFGAGEHIKALRKKNKDAEIRIFEPNEELKSYGENLEFIKNDKKIEIVQCNKEEIEENLNSEFINEFNIQDLNVLIFSNYEKIYIKELRILVETAKAKIFDGIVERNTKFNFSERWFATTINNISYMADSVLIDEYEDLYKDKPAVIVSAGPSLDKNIDELKGIEERFLIITGGRPLKGLIEKEIKPGLLVALDPQEINYKLVEGCIEDTNIPLLFFDCTNEKIVKNHNGFKMFSFATEEMHDFLHMRLKVLSTFGSVAHSMVSTAIILGCNPIIFIGQDFAYTNDAAHSEFLEKKLVDQSKKFNDVKCDLDCYVESVDGGKVRTSRVLNSYRQGMEKIIANNPNIKFINATEGGARMFGTEEMTLKQAIEKYGNSKIKLFNEKKPNLEIGRKIVDKVDEMYDNLIEIRKQCKKAIEYTDELENNLKLKKIDKVSELLNKLNKVDQYLKKKIKSFLIIQSLLYPTMYRILTNRDIEKEKNEKEKIKNIIQQNKELYGTLTEVINNSLDDFLKAKEELKNIKGANN